MWASAVSSGKAYSLGRRSCTYLLTYLLTYFNYLIT